jgi:N-hydroxyarylamine O-acetyltransferase
LVRLGGSLALPSNLPSLKQKQKPAILTRSATRSPATWNVFDPTAYLYRLGLTETIATNVSGLRRLHRAHLLRVPFENLDIHLGRPIRLDPASLFAKIVTHRRGGFCYELNGLFASLLKALGFSVALLSARVANDEGVFGTEFDHLALRIDIDEPYLADVGFGDLFLEPVRLIADVEQNDPCGDFRFVDKEDAWILQRRGTEAQWISLYSLTLLPHRLDDFAEMCLYHQTSAASHFTRKIVCSLATPTGRVTISGDRLIERSGGHRHERIIGTEAEFRFLLANRFGVNGIDRDLLP